MFYNLEIHCKGKITNRTSQGFDTISISRQGGKYLKHESDVVVMRERVMCQAENGTFEHN